MIRRWMRRGVHRQPMRREHAAWPPPADPYLWNQPTTVLYTVPVKPCCGAVLANEECDCRDFAAGTGWYR